MITNKINNTKANAAPEILLFPHPQFMSLLPPFLSLHFYYKQILKICECLLLYFYSFFVIIKTLEVNYSEKIVNNYVFINFSVWMWNFTFKRW